MRIELCCDVITNNILAGPMHVCLWTLCECGREPSCSPELDVSVS